MTDQTMPSVACQRKVTQAMVDRYADVSGDANPLHIDQEYAARTPFGRTIAHGQLLLALLSDAMVEQCGSSWPSAGELDVRFVAPVFADDTVAVHLLGPTDDTVFEVELRVGDRVVVAGTARCRGA